MSDSLTQTWAGTVAAKGSAVAVREFATARILSFRELAEAATGRAQALRENGMVAAPGEAVVLCRPNGMAWLVDFLALLQLDATIVPADATTPAAALDAVGAASRAVALISPSGEQAYPGRRRGPHGGQRKPLLLKITSGTSGVPKVLRFSHAEMAADGRQVASTMGIAPEDVNFACIPLGHSYGLGNLVLPLILQGSAVAIGSSPFPSILAAEIRASGATVFPAVPPLLRGLAESDLPTEALGRLRTVISAGSFLAPEVVRRFRERFDLRVHNFYGSSETGGICYDRSGDAALTGSAVGTPLDGVKVTINRDGFVEVSSAAVLTRGHRLRRDGHGRVVLADRGRLLPDGSLALSGRGDRVVKVGARRLDLGEIEQVVRSLGEGLEAYAGTFRTDARELQIGLVYRSEGSLTREALLARLRDSLPPWKLPKRLIAVQTMPVTARGKPDRARLDVLIAGAARRSGV